jgi:hypothetical protein
VYRDMMIGDRGGRRESSGGGQDLKLRYFHFQIIKKSNP